MNLWPIKVVAEKELKDGYRDRRSLYTMLGPILFGPLVITFMFYQLTALKKSAEEIRVAVTGREFAPALMDWLQQQSGVELVPASFDPESAVRNRKEDLVLSIDKDFATRFAESRAAVIQIFSDTGRSSAQPKVTRLISLLSRYSAETASLRLIARGINPEVASPLKVEEVNLMNPTTILQVVLMFLVVTILTAGMQIATDSTAGERERGSFEALLLNPLSRWQIVTGKWLAAAITAFAGMIVNLLLIYVLLGRLPLEQFGAHVRFDTPQILLLIAAIGPLTLLAPAIQIYFSCSARSFKEAQSYSVFLMLPVVFIGVISMFYPVTARPGLRAIPFLSQYSLGSDILGGKAVASLSLLTVGIEAAAVAAVFLWLAARRFSSEKIIFGH